MANSFLSENQPRLNQRETLNRFTGHTAIIAGGASGIGRATVERFLNDGANVAIFDLNESAGEDLLGWAKERNYTALFCRVDVSNKSECETGVKRVVEKFGATIHCLVNSVAYFGSKGLSSTTRDWEKTFSVNVFGYTNMVQACHPYMKSGKGCAIVNLASISGHRAQLNRWTYCSSKGAVLALTRCMALDLGADGIRVNSVSPGWIWSPEAAKAIDGGDRSKIEPIAACFHIPRRQGETSEVAAAIAFLCSRDAAFITGADLPVDGGYTAMGPEQHGQTAVFAGSDY